MPSGWFPDPLDRYDHRYFNGTAWTSDVSTAGQRFVDPLGVTSGPTGGYSDGSTNGKATAAVVTGSIAVAIAWIPFVVIAGVVLAILAIVFGTIGLRRSRLTGVGRGASIAGLVMGWLGIAASVVGVVLSVFVVQEVIRYVEPGDHEAEVTACTLDDRRAEVTGTITNLDDDPREFTIFVEVGDRRESVIVDELAPGETWAWSTFVPARASLSDCDADLVVNGPFPYGVEVDPIE